MFFALSNLISVLNQSLNKVEIFVCTKNRNEKVFLCVSIARHVYLENILLVFGRQFFFLLHSTHRYKIAYMH